MLSVRCGKTDLFTSTSTDGKAMVRRGIVITVANPAIEKTIVGRKVVERRTKSQIG